MITKNIFACLSAQRSIKYTVISALIMLTFSYADGRTEKFNPSKCCVPTLITQKMINDGLVITEPGVYEFCSSINFAPAAPQSVASTKNKIEIHAEQLKDDIKKLIEKTGRVNFSQVQALINSRKIPTVIQAEATPLAAITIAASDVFIDMKHYKLEQTNLSAGAIGFWIVPGNSNIAIKNGTIEHFQGAGIAAFIDEASDQAAQQYLKNLLFENLTIINNGGLGDPRNGALNATGISLDAATSFAKPNYDTLKVYQDVTIKNSTVSYNTVGGILIAQAADFSIENSQSDYNYVANLPLGFINAVAGIQIYGSENIRLLNSTFNFTQNQATFPDLLIVFMAGAFMATCRNISMQECQFNNTIGDSIFVNGIISGTLSNILADKCQFNNATGLGASCILVEGWHMSDADFAEVSGDGYRITDCQFNKAFSKGGTFGYLQVGGNDFITCKDIVIENSQAIGSTAEGDYPFTQETYGFHIGTSLSNGVSNEQGSTRNIRLKNVTAGDISGTQNAAGIMFNSSSALPLLGFASNYSVENSVISHVTSSSDSQPIDGIRIVAASGDQSSFANLFIKNNIITDIYSSVPSVIPSAIYVSNIQRPHVTGNEISDCANGIILDNGTQKGVVARNIVDNCAVAGIVDTLAPTTNTFISNEVITSGIPSTDETNYAIQWGLTTPPIAHGSLSGVPGYPTTTSTWFNLSMVS